MQILERQKIECIKVQRSVVSVQFDYGFYKIYENARKHKRQNKYNDAKCQTVGLSFGCGWPINRPKNLV